MEQPSRQPGHHQQPFNQTFQTHNTHQTQSGVTGLSSHITLAPNEKRNYAGEGPDGTMTLDVNEPKPSNVTLEKGPHNSNQRFGIQFGNQLVIRNVLENSLADRHSDEIRKGDIILKINGNDVQFMSKDEAMSLAAQNRNRLELLVKKTTGMTVTVPISASNFDQISEGFLNQNSRHHALNDSQPINQNNNTGHAQGEFSSNPNNAGLQQPRIFDNPDKREIIFEKSKRSLGIRLEGGNNAGIFIGNIQPGSPADNQGFQVGDRILEVNGKNFKYLTHEEAIMNLMSIKEQSQVSIVVKASRDAFDKVKESNIRDQFYIRTHFKFDGDPKEPQWNLKFNRGEVFLVYAQGAESLTKNTDSETSLTLFQTFRHPLPRTPSSKAS